MTRTIIATVRGEAVAVDVDDAPALGWRFWGFAGFPGDPVDPRPYGGSRGIPLAIVRRGGSDYWLTAMELDCSAQLFTPHELFPCPNPGGAAEFGLAWISRHAEQPGLFDA